MDKAKKLITWLDKNLLFLLSTFLIAFIPLFPKIPLFDAIPGYIVRVRAEDFLILFTALIWLRDAFKKRFEWNTSFFWFVILYAAVGLLSVSMGTLLQQSVPFELLHIGKSGLHFFRYLEYFALFFFLYSSINSKKQIKIVLVTLVVTLIGIIGYGFGQQYLHFPLYSTMNREFSKGQTLYLQDNARPQSTFAGHYDLGAYLVIVLPIIFALSIGSLGEKKPTAKRKKHLNIIRIALHSVHALGAWMLVTSGSKTALAAYLTGILIVLFFNLRKLGNFRQQLKWGGVAFAVLALGLGTILTIFGKETQSMLLSIAQKNATAHQIITKIPGISIQEADTDPTRPDDLYGEGHEYKLITKQDEYGNEYKVLEKVGSTWSENALKYGISMGIRLDTLWPQAIKGLINNPLFGNAYGTLSAITQGEFVEADSTDNNYLRTLGETGILGFLSFYGLILFVLFRIYKNTKQSNPLVKTLNIGFSGSVIGLLINATYIDVFAASKVAFSFWALAGLAMKSGLLDKNDKTRPESNLASNRILQHIKKHRSFYLAFLLFFILLHKNPYTRDSQIRDFDTSPEAIEAVVATKCYINYGTFSVCRNDGRILKENSNLYSDLFVPFLLINSDPATFYFLNIFLLIFALSVTYKNLVIIFESKKDIHTPNLSKFSLLLIPIVFFYVSRASSQPLLIQNLSLLLAFTPLLTLVYAKYLINKNKSLSLAINTLIISVFLITLYKNNAFEEVLISFRNNAPAYKNWAVRRSTIHLNTKFNPENTNTNYLITSINPYYFDFYKNDNFELLPMSREQEYFSDATLVWPDLTISGLSNEINLKDTYQNLISTGNELYLLDYGVLDNHNYQNSFNDIKKWFDLRYQVIDCDEKCNVFNVYPEQEEVSQIPKSINNVEINLENLSGSYSFSVLSQRYLENQSEADALHNTKTFVTNLNLAGLLNSEQDFMVLTGDVTQDNEDYWKNYFEKNFGNLVKYPIFYNPGNYDTLPIKPFGTKYFSFFSKTDYFIFLDLEQDSKIEKQQKLFVYNALLELEELPNIKNLFIIAHNLDWQDQSNPDNFIHNLENKLADFPSLNKFIITANHDINESNESQTHFAHQINEETKTQYFASLENGQTDFSFIKFNLDSQSNVTYEFVQLDLPKTYSAPLPNDVQ